MDKVVPVWGMQRTECREPVRQVRTEQEPGDEDKRSKEGT